MNNTTLETHPTVNACLWCGKDKGARAKYCSHICGKRYGYRASRETAQRCSEHGCDKPVQARGMCGSHYGTWHRTEGGNERTYTCVGCSIEYITRRKPWKGEGYCTADCQRKHIATNEVSATKRSATLAATLAAKPIPTKECEWCEKEFETRQAVVRYCSELCKKNAAKDRRLKLLSPLRHAYEHGDNAGIITALKDGSVVTPNGCWEWKTIKDGYPRTSFGNRHIAVHRLSLEAKHEAPLGEQAAHHMCANTKCVNPDHLQPVTHRENTAEMLARNSYLKRIAELEAVIKEISPEHAILNRIEMI